MPHRYSEPSVLMALEALSGDLEHLIARHGHTAEFWRLFCERASLIEDLAGPEGWMYVNDELDAMLAKAGVDPGGWSDVFDA